MEGAPGRRPGRSVAGTGRPGLTVTLHLKFKFAAPPGRPGSERDSESAKMPAVRHRGGRVYSWPLASQCPCARHDGAIIGAMRLDDGKKIRVNSNIQTSPKKSYCGIVIFIYHISPNTQNESEDRFVLFFLIKIDAK